MNIKSPASLQKFLANLNAVVWFLGLHLFLFIVFLVIISFGLGALIFYNYFILPGQEEPVVNEKVIKFNLTKYQNVLNQLEARGATVTKPPVK